MKGGLTGFASAIGANVGKGSICVIETGSAKTSVAVLAPTTWASMSYSYSSAELYATVGEKSPSFSPLSPPGSSLPPTRFSAHCAGAEFAFDIMSGLATWEGHQIFTLDVSNGDLQLNPEESLTKSLDALAVHTAVRRTISLKCTIFGHYEWVPAGAGPVLTHRLSIELRDQTCWAQRTQSFANRVLQDLQGHQSEDACRSLCRGRANCTHWGMYGGKCHFYSSVCKSANINDYDCAHKNVLVTERYPGCGERHSCVDIKLPGYHYISGKYCPAGENSASAAQGPLYFKTGLTNEESFWLMRGSSSACSSENWAIVQPEEAQDYENRTMAYVELHGETVACLMGNSGDLPSDIFGQSTTKLTVTRLAAIQGATATVVAPGCTAPNVTVVTVDGPEEESTVEALKLDDPASDTVDDHWLHPCQCIPTGWGNLPPVFIESISEVPAGSNNEFLPSRINIVDGQFVCGQKYLTAVIEETETDALDDGSCKMHCMDQQCSFYWEGEVLSTKQCRIYSQCTELVREVGVTGVLYGMAHTKACKIADPARCWRVTKRRSFLGANLDGGDSYDCLYQDLLEQCDQKLTLGGRGVTSCGLCEYAPAKAKELLGSNDFCADAANGKNVYLHPCHGGKNQKWYFEKEWLKAEHNSSLCLTYATSPVPFQEGNVELDSCKEDENAQKWYWDGLMLKSRFHDDRCLDWDPEDKNILLRECPDRIRSWAWKHKAHGGQQMASDQNGKCWTHNTQSNDVEVNDCGLAMKYRWYWDGDSERLKSEADSSKCLTISSRDDVYMDSCHSLSNQQWYFDGKLIKSRADDRCLDFTSVGELVRGNCPDSPSKKWRWGPALAKPMPRRIKIRSNSELCWSIGANENVEMATCNDEERQQWYLEDRQLRSPSSNKCVDMGGGGNLYMHRCHGHSNQRFSWDGERLKIEADDKCIDANHLNNLYMHMCHGGLNQKFYWDVLYSEVPRRIKIRSNSDLCWSIASNNNLEIATCNDEERQQWYFQGRQLRSSFSHNCVDMSNDGNLYMHPCHGGSNQRFSWDGERLKIEADDKCIDANHLNNLYMHMCHGGLNQKFYWDELYYKGKTLRSDSSCLDINGHQRAVVFHCHEGANQRFYFEGEALKVESDANLCLNYGYGADNLFLEACQDKGTQKFYFDNLNIRTRQSDECLDIRPFSSEAFMSSCPTSKTLQWTHKSQLHNSVQLTISLGSGSSDLRCLSVGIVASVGDPMYRLDNTDCQNVEAKNLWYLDGGLLKTEHNPSQCWYYRGGFVTYGSCNAANSQKFIDDGGHLRVIGSNLCLNYYRDRLLAVAVGFCPGERNHQWRFGSAFAKAPLPTAFQHGQSLRASCWSERFAAGS